MNTTRRAFTILLAAASLAIGLGGCATAPHRSASRTEMIREKLMSSDRNYVFVAMHRGDWRNYPENSRDAILSCIALGADIVELDVQMTKDGRFVLLHDDKLDRTTTGKGKVSEHTLAEVKQLRLKSNQGGKDAKATDYEVLTLEEAQECLSLVHWVDLPIPGGKVEDTQYSNVYDQKNITLALRSWYDYENTVNFNL